MSKTIQALLALLTLLTLAVAPIVASESGGRAADHVVLVSIDGLRPEFYLDERWPAPMIQQMRAEGAYALGMRGVYPSVTYPSHTTMITGALPARHGVYYNSPFEPAGQTGRWYWEAASIRVPTLWDLAAAAGLESANLGWPVGVGAPVKWNLPEIWSLDEKVTSIEVLAGASAPEGLWEEVEQRASGQLTRDTFDIAHITRDDRAGDIAAYLLAEYRPGLLTVHLIESDHFQHEDGRDSPMARRAVAAADRAISQMVEAAERVGILERTAFVIVGDHGFLDLHTRVAPNVWLAEAGLQASERHGDDWRATFHTSGAAAFLHLADPEDQEAASLVRDILEGRPAEERALYEILDRAELDALGAAPEAALGLAMAPGVSVSSSARPPAVRATSGATHGFLPDQPALLTGFIAWGSGVADGTRIERIHQEDVAPFVARLLDLELEAVDGVLRPELLAETGVRLPESRMAQRIVSALGPGLAGNRVMLRYDAEALPELPVRLTELLEERDVIVERLPYGPVERFATRLAATDIYVWLPFVSSPPDEPMAQIETLYEWTVAGRGRQVHFHWADGTRQVDGGAAAHTAAFDELYLEALDIDYAALDRVQRGAEMLLRSAPIRVTTPAGTDLSFSIGDRPVTLQNGDASWSGTRNAVVPIAREIELPAGVLRVAPVESTVEGLLVIPGAAFGDGYVENLRLRFQGGELREWSADSGAEQFEAALGEQPALAHFRELGIGFNPRLVPPEGDDRIPYFGYGAGAVRLSLGNNEELGGEVTGEGVRWMFFPEATVRVGETTLVDGGRLSERFRVGDTE